MKGHKFRVTIEHVATPKGEAVEREPLVFEAVNHDDIVAIAERMIASGKWGDKDQAAQLLIGLKMFSEVALWNRDDPLFAAVRPALSEFVAGLKGRNRAEAAE